MSRTTRAHFIVRIALIALAPLACLAQTATFNLPPQPLADSLKAVGAQTGLNIMVSPPLVDGKQAPALKANLSAKDALARLLVGTKLEYHFVNDQTVVIRAAQSVAANDPPATQSTNPPTQDTTKEAGKNSSQDFRVAQVDQAPAGPQVGNNETSKEEKKVQLQEVVVTGTHIRGITESTSPVTAYDRQAIADSGFANTQDFINSIPQNFGGGSAGASQDGILGPGANAQANNEAASGANLRGLGNTSTLVLLDGHRMAPSAFGGIVDLSLIPLSAIDRIDVLTDGASAVYGSDAVGGVINFVLRKDYEGAETRVSYGSVTEGSMNQESAAQTVGHNWEGGGAMASVQYDRQTNLPTSQRSFTATALGPSDILPSYNKLSGIFTAHQSLLPNLDLFAELLVSHNDVDRDFNNPSPGFGFLRTESSNSAYNGTAGLGYEPFGDWRFELSGTYSRQHDEVVLPAASVPSPGYVLGAVAGATTDAETSADLKADGTLLQLGSVKVKGALGASFRREDFVSLIPYLPESDPSSDRLYDRSVSSAFAELNIPLFDHGDAITLFRRLVISAALRYDHYSDFGKTTNPKLGLLWEPIDQLGVHGSWGKSFRAPDANELINRFLGQSVIGFDLTAPSGNGTVPAFILSGVNPDLGPETATTWNVGVSYKTDGSPVELGLDYYDIDYRNRITTPPFVINVLQSPGTYGSLISSVPNDAAAATYLAQLISQAYTYYDYTMGGTGSVGVRYIYDARTINAALVHQTGLDASAKVELPLGTSTIGSRLDAALINEIETAFAPGATAVDLVNTYSNPLRLRMREDLYWSRMNWRISAAVNYSNSYRDTTVSPAGTLGAYVTTDATIRFSGSQSNASSLIRGFSVALSASNLFNASPPFVVNPATPGIHYDVGNANPMGRFLTLQFREEW